MNLQKFRLRDCHGLLFEGPRDPASDMAPLFSRPEFNFGDYVLDHVEVHQCNYNWKTFIEVYLEDYHVGPFHPGLGRFVTCDDLTWEFNDCSGTTACCRSATATRRISAQCGSRISRPT
ncbi:hypothetical protein G6F40_016794 [Rhizopus arrhizus]|nr:hypothetical protein G6F40_016794 [Rhizopus arrhizus]